MFSTIFFSSTENDGFPDLEHYQMRIFRFFLISALIASAFGCFLSLLWPSNFLFFSFQMLFLCLLIYWAHKHYYHYAVRVGLFSINFLVIYQSYITSSAYSASLLGLILIMVSILLKHRELFVFLFIDSVYILLMLIFGHFTLNNVENVNGIALVNNMTILIPSMICAFFIGMVISKVLLSTIRAQQDQYEKLQKTKDMLITQEKIESIRVLAGGIAHDFNNILVSIMGNLSLLSLKESGRGNKNRNDNDNNGNDNNGNDNNGNDNEDTEIINEMLQAAKRARNLTEQLLLYTKKTPFKKELISDIETLIKETVNFSLRGRKSKAEYRISDDIGTIFGDRMKISQVIQNLVINADEAYESSGIIEISVYNQTISAKDSNQINESDESKTLISQIVPGEYLVIEVKDHASGIPKEIIAKIFDPYFTTKEKGTGLGLAISLSIIQEHNGYLSLKSDVGVGSTFKMYFPRVDVISSASNELSSIIKPDLSNISVFIIDDDTFNVNMLTRMLSECKAHISSDKCGESLIEKIKTMEKMPDLVIIDFIMPGFMNGLECIRMLKQISPTTKYILTSGYNKETVLSSSIPVDAYLKKPYTFEELIAAIESVRKNNSEKR